MKELYEAPDFAVIRFATEDNITQSKDNMADADDIFGTPETGSGVANN